ncbi:MAG TPA: DUF6789 family protein [Polyangia bacterium]|jgi:hypothetical protein|nr:DUF6789 family protein [Polyangia bacterium]
MNSVVRGAVVGAAATLPMSVVMGAGHEAKALGAPPPRKISERLIGALGRWPRRARREGASLASHFLFGAAAGAAFSPALGRVATGPARIVIGAVYGAAIWATMYGHVLPALGLMATPGRDRSGRPLVVLAAHLVYGAALGALTPAGARD